MKVKRFEGVENIENRLEKSLLKILDDELYTESNSYCTISEDGKICAIKEIIEYLISLGIDLNMYLDSKKYNI